MNPTCSQELQELDLEGIHAGKIMPYPLDFGPDLFGPPFPGRLPPRRIDAPRSPQLPLLPPPKLKPALEQLPAPRG